MGVNFLRSVTCYGINVKRVGQQTKLDVLTVEQNLQEPQHETDICLEENVRVCLTVVKTKASQRFQEKMRHHEEERLLPHCNHNASLLLVDRFEPRETANAKP